MMKERCDWIVNSQTRDSFYRLDFLLHILAFAFFMVSQIVLLPASWRSIKTISLITMLTVMMTIGLLLNDFIGMEKKRIDYAAGFKIIKKLNDSVTGEKDG